MPPKKTKKGRKKARKVAKKNIGSGGFSYPIGAGKMGGGGPYFRHVPYEVPVMIKPPEPETSTVWQKESWQKTAKAAAPMKKGKEPIQLTGKVPAKRPSMDITTPAFLGRVDDFDDMTTMRPKQRPAPIPRKTGQTLKEMISKAPPMKQDEPPQMVVPKMAKRKEPKKMGIGGGGIGLPQIMELDSPMEMPQPMELASPEIVAKRKESTPMEMPLSQVPANKLPDVAEPRSSVSRGVEETKGHAPPYGAYLGPKLDVEELQKVKEPFGENMKMHYDIDTASAHPVNKKGIYFQKIGEVDGPSEWTQPPPVQIPAQRLSQFKENMTKAHAYAEHKQKLDNAPKQRRRTKEQQEATVNQQIKETTQRLTQQAHVAKVEADTGLQAHQLPAHKLWDKPASFRVPTQQQKQEAKAGAEWMTRKYPAEEFETFTSQRRGRPKAEFTSKAKNPIPKAQDMSDYDWEVYTRNERKEVRAFEERIGKWKEPDQRTATQHVAMAQFL